MDQLSDKNTGIRARRTGSVRHIPLPLISTWSYQLVLDPGERKLRPIANKPPNLIQSKLNSSSYKIPNVFSNLKVALL